MFQVLRRDVRIFGGNGFLPSARRSLCALLLALLVPVGAFAYTIVLKSGRTIEIPSQFTVTPRTLTYETAPGINVTLLMSIIDIPATERANNEPAGSLLKRAEAKPTVNAATPVQRQTPRRELTQADIEAARRAREKSEQDYERRRKELGLPSLEESRRRTEEETKRLQAAAQQSEAENRQSEAYWRARADELRTEMVALDAEINYLRQSIGQTPDYSDLGSYAFITGSVCGFPCGFPVTRFPVVVGHPGFMHGINGTSAPQAGFQAFGGFMPQNQIQPRGVFPRGNFRHGGIGGRGGVVISPAIIGVPLSNYDYTNDRAYLITRLHELEAEQAGLQARWQELEDEARRAGVPPGWLRP